MVGCLPNVSSTEGGRIGRTYQALLRAQREREAAHDLEPPESRPETESRLLLEDVAALRVSVDALEDRIELELPAFQAELRETIAKAAQSSARSHPSADQPSRADLPALRAGVERIERSLRWLLALAAIVSGLALLRC